MGTANITPLFGVVEVYCVVVYDLRAVGEFPAFQLIVGAQPVVLLDLADPIKRPPVTAVVDAS